MGSKLKRMKNMKNIVKDIEDKVKYLFTSSIKYYIINGRGDNGGYK